MAQQPALAASLDVELDDLYHAPHGWASDERVAPLIEQRLAGWHAMGRPQYID